MRNLSFIIHCSLFILLSGCSDRPADLPKLYPVSATVLLNGKPLDKTIVACYPEDGGGKIGKWFSGGTTDVNGTVVFRTKGLYNGIPLGNYKVVITKAAEGKNSTPEHPKIYRVVHSKYESVETTPLTCTIEKGTKKLEFKIEPAPPNELIDN